MNYEGGDTALVSYRQPTVEDEEYDMALAIVDAPPPCPSPPLAPGAVLPITPAQMSAQQRFSIFDFQVDETPGQTPNASQLDIQMSMKNGAARVFDSSRDLEPIEDEDSQHRYEYTTPANKTLERRDSMPYSTDREGTTGKKDKKRKRVHDIDTSATRPRGSVNDNDAMMLDAPTLHTGLTGGLHRMMRRGSDYPSPSYSTQAEPDVDMGAASTRAERGDDIMSPVKRSRTVEFDETPIDGEKRRRSSRVHRSSTRHGTGSVRHSSHREHRSSSRRHSRGDDVEPESPEEREHRRRKHRSVRRSSGNTLAIEAPPMTIDERLEDGEQSGNLKAIEYHPSPPTSSTPPSATFDKSQALIPHHTHSSQDETHQLVPYNTEGTTAAFRARAFCAMVQKGLESERGCSVHKILKRYHRDRCGSGRGRDVDDKVEEEKKLFSEMRLKRNDRGEVVVFF
jgi:cell growth-regulating nucleolar protein